MAKNYVQEGDVITLVAPYAVSAGAGALVGSLFGIALSDVASGASGEFRIEGVFDITALSTDVATQGTKVYWDNTNKRITVTSAGNTLVGAVTQAKASGDTTARVYLDGAVR